MDPNMKRLLKISHQDDDFSRDEEIGVDQWISISIKGKRREFLKKQVSNHINKMKIHRFDYRT